MPCAIGFYQRNGRKNNIERWYYWEYIRGIIARNETLRGMAEDYRTMSNSRRFSSALSSRKGRCADAGDDLFPDG